MLLEKASGSEKFSSITGIFAMILYLSCRLGGKKRISTLKTNDIIYPLSKRRRIRKKKHRTKKKGREFTVEKLVNFLPPSYFQVMTKVYKNGKEEKRYIWIANFRV